MDIVIISQKGAFMLKEFTKEELNLIDSFRKLNDTGRAAAAEKIADYTEISKYTQTDEERKAAEKVKSDLLDALKETAESFQAATVGTSAYKYSDLKALREISLDDHGSLDEWLFAWNCYCYGYYCGKRGLTP